MNIAVYSLAKNESQHVERWEASCRDADVRVVTDTGSTDGTDKLLEAAGVTVVRGCPSPWRWDDAHNLSLMHVPDNVDVCVRLDLDESIEPGWREAIEKDWVDGVTKLRYWYWWSPEIRFLCDRVHARTGYRWQGATHEGLVPWAIEEKQGRSDGIVIRHHRDPEKKHAADMTLLRKAVEENPLDARMAWYLARELHYADDAECVPAFERYLKLPGGSPCERSYAWRVLAERDKARTGSLMFRAMVENPLEPEAHVYAAKRAFEKHDSVGALYWARQAIACHSDNRSHTSDHAAYGDGIAYMAYSMAYELGLIPEALQHAREAAERAPENAMHRKNVEALTTLITEDGPKPY